MTSIRLEITKVKVLITNGTDKVLIKTTLPPPYPPCISDGPLTISFDVTKGKGIQYVKDNFQLEPEVVEV